MSCCTHSRRSASTIVIQSLPKDGEKGRGQFYRVYSPETSSSPKASRATPSTSTGTLSSSHCHPSQDWIRWQLRLWNHYQETSGFSPPFGLTPTGEAPLRALLKRQCRSSRKRTRESIAPLRLTSRRGRRGCGNSDAVQRAQVDSKETGTEFLRAQPAFPLVIRY